MVTHSLVDFSPVPSHTCAAWSMYLGTKFLRLGRAVEWCTVIEGWQVCWLGGWDKNRMLFVVMVERVIDGPVQKRTAPAEALSRSCQSVPLVRMRLEERQCRFHSSALQACYLLNSERPWCWRQESGLTGHSTSVVLIPAPILDYSGQSPAYCNDRTEK